MQSSTTDPNREMRITMALALYRGFAAFPGPMLAQWLMKKRLSRGKEDPSRVAERFGKASIDRPAGALAWFHAASVGESLSLLPLLEALRQQQPSLNLLVTTGTRTSAELMAKRLPANVIHQYAPVDTAPAIRAFLAHWRPSLLAVVESEIWPTMLVESKKAGVATALISARFSASSATQWSYASRSIASLLNHFDVILAQTPEIMERLTALGADHRRVEAAGSLKDAAEPLPYDSAELSRWRRQLDERPVWIAASTHPGDETLVLSAHETLRSKFPNLMTIIAPRHPERCDEIAEQILSGDYVARRSSEIKDPDDQCEIILVDRLGELGLWYRLADLALIGGSFGAVGGHNPMEPARVGTPVLFGPDMANFTGERAKLLAANAGAETKTTQLAEDIELRLRSQARRTSDAVEAQADALRRDGEKVLARHVEQLLKLIEPRGEASAGAKPSKKEQTT